MTPRLPARPPLPPLPPLLQNAVSSWGIITAMAFGMSIMALAYGIGHISGCHLNAAITASLMMSGNCSAIQGVANICSQLVGSILGAGLLYGTTPDPGSSSIGSNAGVPNLGCRQGRSHSSPEHAQRALFPHQPSAPVCSFLELHKLPGHAGRGGDDMLPVLHR